MRAAVPVLLLCIACAAGDVIKVYAQDEAYPIEQQQEQEPQSEMVFLVDQEASGALHVTGMLQKFRLDGAGFSTFNSLLTRPQTSYIDLSWSNWIDQRLEVLDMLQELLVPVVPRCSHMRADSSSLDTSMVSYLASSRFGPAILTTYSQQFQELDDEDDFDYEEVFIPEGESVSVSKSYEDASLLEDLSADADMAFEKAEADPRLLSQQQGFFGTNVKSTQDKAMYTATLDGDSESLQPNVRKSAPLKYTSFNNLTPQKPSFRGADFAQSYAAMDAHQIAGLVLFMMLCFGCIYVWVSLLFSCVRMTREMRRQRWAAKKQLLQQGQDALLAPLMPEGAKHFDDTEVAAAAAVPAGTYYAPQGVEYVTVTVPLINGQYK